MVKKQRRVRFSKKNQTRVFETTPDEAFNRGYFIRCMDLREQKKNYTHQKQTIRELQQKTLPFLNLCERMRMDPSFKRFVEENPYQKRKFHNLFLEYQKLQSQYNRYLKDKKQTKTTIKEMEKKFKTFSNIRY